MSRATSHVPTDVAATHDGVMIFVNFFIAPSDDT
jgi:hypothetical protein